MDPLTPPVAAVVDELLAGPVGAAFAELCGPDAVLRECSAVVSAPGSPPQPCHSDHEVDRGSGARDVFRGPAGHRAGARSD